MRNTRPNPIKALLTIAKYGRIIPSKELNKSIDTEVELNSVTPIYLDIDNTIISKGTIPIFKNIIREGSNKETVLKHQTENNNYYSRITDEGIEFTDVNSTHYNIDSRPSLIVEDTETNEIKLLKLTDEGITLTEYHDTSMKESLLTRSKNKAIHEITTVSVKNNSLEYIA